MLFSRQMDTDPFCGSHPSLCCQCVLGRISSSVLGTYGLLIVFSAIVTTFFLLGGSQVVVRFLLAGTPGGT